MMFGYEQEEGWIILGTVVFMSLTYLWIGIGINNKNAKHLLTHYNTVSHDIEGYMKWFKPYFKKLSAFTLLSFFLFSLSLKGDVLVAVWAILVGLAHIPLISVSLKFKK